MVESLFLGQMLFSFAVMYVYGKIKYQDGLQDGIALNIERVQKND